MDILRFYADKELKIAYARIRILYKVLRKEDYGQALYSFKNELRKLDEEFWMLNSSKMG